MKDKLEIFTEGHRESFESYSLDVDEAWTGIEDKLNKLDNNSTQIPWAKILKVAAVFVCVVAVAFGFYLNSQRISMNENGIALHNISLDLADTEAFYASRIDEKMKLIEISVGDINPAVYNQLEILDEDYDSLKNDLKDNAASEEVINAMIEYYRLKLALLEKILDEIQKNNNNEEVLAI